MISVGPVVDWKKPVLSLSNWISAAALQTNGNDFA